jgi:hypothetical protein
MQAEREARKPPGLLPEHLVDAHLLGRAKAGARFDERGELWYIAACCWGRSVVVNMSACQAEDRGFESRRPGFK